MAYKMADLKKVREEIENGSQTATKNSSGLVTLALTSLILTDYISD